MAENQKVIFLLDSGAHFSILPFSPGPQSNDNDHLVTVLCYTLSKYGTNI
jgi:hypothetical protein